MLPHRTFRSSAAQRLLHGKVECSCGQTIGRCRRSVSFRAAGQSANTFNVRATGIDGVLFGHGHQRIDAVPRRRATRRTWPDGSCTSDRNLTRNLRPVDRGKRTGESDSAIGLPLAAQGRPHPRDRASRPDGPGLQGRHPEGGQATRRGFPGCRRRRARRDPGNASPGAAERRADSGTAASFMPCSSDVQPKQDDELRSALRQLRATSSMPASVAVRAPAPPDAVQARNVYGRRVCGASSAVATSLGARVDLDLVAGGHEQWEPALRTALAELGGLRDLTVTAGSVYATSRTTDVGSSTEIALPSEDGPSHAS